MDQSNIKDTTNITLKPALSATYDELLAYAKTHSIKIRDNLNKEVILQQLLSRLEMSNANLRLDALVALFEENGLESMPGHGKNSPTNIVK